MSLTFIGFFLVLAGLPILFFGGTGAALVFILACGPMGGSAALLLPALGGSSVTPACFAMAIGVLRVCVSQARLSARTVLALRDNWPFLGFVLYGAATAYIGPRLFRGALEVPPLRILHVKYIYAALPLAPSSQNITTAVYLVGTAACALIAYIACKTPEGWRVLVRAAIVIAGINVGLGLLSIVAPGTPLELFFAIFRNGAYAQLEHSYGSFVRITGLFPEASSYSTYTFIWFCFLTECWYRNVMPRRTGPVAFALFMILALSTSSSAYLSLTGYGVIFALRMLLPGAARSDKLARILLSLVVGGMFVSIILMVKPALAAKFVDMLLHMTVEKRDSFSGLQRAFWARKALEAFWASYGLGVGPGSFRSSSLITAILGSTGVFGMGLFLVYLAKVFKPAHRSTYVFGADPRVSTGIAASWAALLSLIPYGVSAPSCDPGADFGVLAGAALALRAAPMLARRARSWTNAAMSRPAGGYPPGHPAE